MDRQDWQRCIDFHGHSCPGLAMGFKAVEAAARHLNLQFSKDEELLCVTENDACGVDAVQVLTGCSMGKGNLVYRKRGKMAFSFFKRATGEKIRVVLKKQFPRDGDRQQIQEMILNSDPDDLFACKTPQFTPPETARMFTSIICENCGESAAEHLIRLHEGKKLCLDCFSGYSRGW
ncbi:MAG: FmdE family protein [Trichlorobacter sp.]|nr:FmdE family protein [Trichlorobacter sp.]